MISLIAALALNRAIGFQDGLLYRLPDDMRRFKTLTTGNTIIMGRRTWESFPRRPLPLRRNIVLSRRQDFIAGSGAEVFPSLTAAFESCAAADNIYIIGGGMVYAEALPLADRLCLTLVDDMPLAADTFFPSFDTEREWKLVAREDHAADSRHAHAFSFLDYERIGR